MAQPFIEFVHPDDRETSLKEVAGLAVGIAIITFENRFRHKDGSYVWLSWTATPSLETGRLYAAGHDITERKRAEAEIVGLNAELAQRAAHLELQNGALERALDINRALLDASVDGIRLVDLEGRTLLANPVIEQLAREVFRFPLDTTFQGRRTLATRLTDPAAYVATMDAIADDPECSTKDDFEITELRRAFQRHTGPVRNAAGELIGRIYVVREITAEHEAARLKSELVATVSHELRTPLAGVIGFAELLLRDDLDDSTRRRYAETIEGEAWRLTALVDDFLDLQRLESGNHRLAHEPFDLSELLRSEVDLFSAQSADHHLELVCAEEPLAVVGDRDRVGQVISNLLSNAIKYSPAGGAVTITAARHEDSLRVSVGDTGIGIPADQQGQVFDRFFRVDSSDTRKIGGTGLGLALCQDIVAAHGGRMGFESTEGAGSRFWFDLPR
jgi:signal transduction histidine kinase